MPWLKLNLHTRPEAVDWVSTLLAVNGYTGKISITAYARSIANSQPEPEESTDWEFTIHLFLPYAFSASMEFAKVDGLLSSLRSTRLISDLQADVLMEPPDPKDFSAPTPHRIGQRFVVLPSAEATYEHRSPDEILLKLQPSLSFGSGLHPVTGLALQLLERHLLPGMSALDLGCGSGILSVAMAALGATVLALDNDSLAVQATQAAIDLNQQTDQVKVMTGSLGSGSELGHWMGGNLTEPIATIQPNASFDLIVANILARVHIALAPEFQHALRRTKTEAGVLITAGFTTDYQADVEAALTEAGFEAIDSQQSNEWIALAHRLK